MDAHTAEETENLFDLPPSNFPCLDANPGASTVWQSTEIPFRDLTLLQSFCIEYNVSPLSVWQAAWALVLRCYLANQSVCFACEVSKEAADADQSLLSNTSDDLLCKAEIEAEVPVIDLLRGMKTIKHNPSSHLARASLSCVGLSLGLAILPANTLLIFHEHERQDWLQDQKRGSRDGSDGGLVDVRFKQHVVLQ